MRFFMGAPLKPTIALIDTGSNLIWTQCSPCKRCMRQLYPIFNPQSPDTYKEVRCGSRGCSVFSPSSEYDRRREKCIYNVHYGDGSYSRGAVAAETFVFRSSTRGLLNFHNIVFGCVLDNYFQIRNAGSGIVGLGAGRAWLVTQFGYDQFSYCLIPTGGHNMSSKLHFGSNAVVSGGGVVSKPLSEGYLPVYYI